MIFVVNKYKHTSTSSDFYIGRGSPLGNPYTSLDISKTKAKYHVASRQESIEKFKLYLKEKIEEKDFEICDNLNKIFLKALQGDVYLVCFCKPQSCHGDIIKEVVDSKLNNLNK